MATDPRLTTVDLLDRLQRHFAVQMPSRIVDDVDRHVQAAIASSAARSTRGRDARRRSWPGRRVVTILAVGAMLAAASPALRFFEGWGEEFDRVFALSTPIDLSVTDDGSRVTIVRAYADPSGLRLAITAEDLEDRGWTEIAVSEPSVTDADDRTFPMSIGWFGQPSRTSSEGWLEFDVPAAVSTPATRSLNVTFDRLDVRLSDGATDPDRIWTSVAGAWSFEFDLEFLGSRTVQPAVSATVGEITVSMQELTVTPATTIVALTFAGLPAGGLEWDPDLAIARDGRTIKARTTSWGTADDTRVYELASGFDDLSGTWTITIDDFHRPIPDPSSNVTTEQESIVGPWVLTFEGTPADAP